MFGGRRYEVREELGFGASYGVYADQGDEPLLLSSEESLAIKEDFRFAEPDSGEQVLWVKAESVLDVAAVYDVIDERTGEYVGAIERNVTSMLKHSYTVRNHRGDEVATIREDSWPKAVIRRNVTSALPFTYHITGSEGKAYGTISEGLGFRDQYSIELKPREDTAGGDGGPDGVAPVDIESAEGETAPVPAKTTFDPRLAVVSIVIIDAVENL